MIRKFLASLVVAASNRKGVTAAEYAVLAVGIVIVVAGAASVFCNDLVNVFQRLGSAVASTGTSAG